MPPPLVSPPTSVDAPVSVDAPAPLRAVPLERAVETVRLVLRAAAEHGAAHARLQLHPRELGGVEVHLRHTAEGLVARVVAEHASAAQLLQQAGAELRRSLETQGLTLLRLDIGASGEQGGRPAGERRDASADGIATGAAPAGDEETSTDPTSETTLALPNGALVDVLA